ncbi:MAG: hypothetical protein A4S09_14340 [Proteobacteria bacterium SG_bin7]|nr:MAG: hypothetical protein A4S09_14340 [Proteobacteria bacterium SG_bin7]
MKNLGVILFILVIKTQISHGSGPNAVSKERRHDYIAGAIASLRKTPSDKLNAAMDYLNVVENDHCRSHFIDLKLKCLIGESKSYCKDMPSADERNKCQFYSDLIIINKLSQKNFIGTHTHYNIMKNKIDVDTEIRRVLGLRYAGLTTEFAMSRHLNCPRSTAKCLAPGIDSYCLATADARNLTWQSCVGALVWFVGLSRNRF